MKIIVIGAGLSGLAAAYRLQEAGHEVQVLETNDWPGGRCKALRRDGFIIDTCPELAATSYRRWLALVRSVGLEGDIVDMPMVMGMLKDGHPIYLDLKNPLSLAFTPLLSLRAKLKFLRGAYAMRHDVRAIPNNLLEIATLDDPASNALELSTKAFGREVTEYLMDPLLRSIGGTALKEMSTLIVPYTLSDWTAMISLRGGLDRVPQAVAARLKVRYRTTVDRVLSNAQDVTIEYTEASGETGTFSADKCLITAPYDLAEDMYPRFGEISGGYRRTVPFLHMIDVKLAYSKAPDSKAAAVMYSFRESREINVVILTHNKAPDRAPAGHGLFSVFTEHLEYERMAAMSDDELIDLIRPQVEKLYPEIKGHFLFSHINRRPRASYVPDPGFFHRTRKLWDAVGHEPRVHLGGDVFNFGSMEAAVSVGERAANRLVGIAGEAQGMLN